MTGEPVRWCRHPEALWRGLLDGVAVLAGDGTDPAVLTGLAAVLWHALDQPVTAEELVDDLAAIGVAEDTPGVVLTTLEDLAARALVERL